MGRSRGNTAESSDDIKLSVTAVLTIYPANQVFRGESVTLVCDIQGGGGSEWTYHWYNSGNTFYSYSTTEQCKLSSVSESDSGEYTCRGKVEGSTQYSDTSTAVKLTVSVTTPSVTLIVSPSRCQHFTTDFLSLICEGQSDSTGWRVRRYSLSESKVSDCSSGWGSVTGSTCSISSLYTSHTGVYWCESESGGSSNPVNITVDEGDVILVSPVHPLTEGDPLTLHCLFLYTKPLDLTADFYKDGLLLQNQTTGEMTIPTVSKSDEGLYHCTILQIGESPQSWISVRARPTSEAPFSVLRLLSSLMAASPYLLLTIILVVKCYKSQGKKSLTKIKYSGWPRVLKKS
uniref:Ig-like domain-containing protein n=1 Tax=Astyanax mexicanus TaxID=7994 RepID=A0A3B1K2S1_ASTMX